MWFRVDNRLIHGQVIEGWLPYTGAKHLIVVNDALANDFLRQQIMSLAVSRHIDVHFVTIATFPKELHACGTESLVLFENCQDVRRAAERGVPVNVLNIGNLHYAPGKHQILPHVAVSDGDIEDLRYLIQKKLTHLDFRAVPSEAEKAPDEHLF